MLDFDYVMPPLRPGLPPYRLHLMCFLRKDEGRASLPAPQVAAFLRELAAALGADLAAHEDTAGMMAALAARGDLHLLPLPRARRSEEHPSELQSLMRTSYAFFCLKKK